MDGQPTDTTGGSSITPVPGVTDARGRFTSNSAGLDKALLFMRRRLSRPLTGVVIIVAASLIALLLLAVLTNSVDGEMLWPEVARALVSILAVALIGGTVKLLLDQFVREREKRALESAFIRDSIIEAENIRGGIEQARMLIMAHRSARSYRDRMQDIIALRIRLDSLQRNVAARWVHGEHADQVKAVTSRAKEVDQYLNKLVCEYRDRYKPISDQQRLDEAEVDAKIGAYVALVRHAADQQSGSSQDRLQPEGSHQASMPAPVRPTLRWTAWDELVKLRWLSDLMSEAGNTNYKSTVDANCTKTIAALNEILMRTLK